MCGAIAARSTGSGPTGRTLIAASAPSVSPENDTLPSRSNGTSTARYSRMWRAGLSNDTCSMPSITTWWERPIPSVNRPPLAMSVVTAWRANATG